MPTLAPRPAARALPRARFLAAGSLLALALGLVAGCDSPACVFGGDCSDGSGGGPGGGLGEFPASLPVDGQWIDAAAPTVQRMHPTGTGADAQTPIVLVFSETLAEAPPASSFELRATTGGGMPIGLGTPVLLGDGRVVVLRPDDDLDAGVQYELVLGDGAQIADLNGQALVRPSDDVLGSFTVASTPSTAPALLTTFPLAGSSFQSTTGELVVVFTRPMLDSSFDDSSFAVTVGGGSPTFDPAPTSLVLADPFPIVETRVWTWRSVDTEGRPASLGRGVTVQLALSPAGHTLVEDDGTPDGGDALPSTTLTYSTVPFEIDQVRLVSTPDDAINLENVTDGAGGMNPLDLRVDVLDVVDGDRVELFLFGGGASAGMGPPPLISLRREAPVGTTGASVQLDLGEPTLDLAAGSSPDSGRFSDGTLAIALRVRRGLQGGPVVLLDVDPLALGIQDPTFDLHPPTLLGIGPSGTVLGLGRSDLPDVAVVGTADERVRAVFVDSTLGANGADPRDPPPSVGSTSGGLFVAAPILFPGSRGVVPPASLPLALDVTILDQALNPAVLPTTVLWTQLGASGPDDAGSPNDVTVEVFDATTLAAIVGARVYAHVDDGLTPVLREQGTTGMPDGTVTLDRSTVPGEEVLVTVDAPGYDLFTFQGVPTSRLSVPLVPRALADASASGSLTTTDNELSSVPRRVGDTRRGERRPQLATVSACSFSGGTQRFECPFGPLAIAPRRLGAQSGLALSIPAAEGQYSAAAFLLGFGLTLPVAPVAPGASAQSTVTLGPRLSSADTPFEERALDLPVHTMDTAAYPSPPNPPSITVEGLAPGLSGALVVGAGVAFANGADAWRVRAAWPGAADVVGGSGDALGSLVLDGTIEQDLFLRAEVLALSGARGVARPRLLERLTSPSPLSTLLPPAPAQLLTPAPNGSTTAGFPLSFSDVLADVSGTPRGLYRVVLSDGAGRRWILWRPDPPGLGANDGRIVVPDIGSLGGSGLAVGTIRCTISAFRWESLDPNLFLWSQVERQATAASHAAELSFTLN